MARKKKTPTTYKAVPLQADEVQALIKHDITQFTRPLRGAPTGADRGTVTRTVEKDGHTYVVISDSIPDDPVPYRVKLPYSKGDILWVRESYYIDHRGEYLVWKADKQAGNIFKKDEEYCIDSDTYFLASAYEPKPPAKWSASTNMPEWAARFKLSVDEVVVRPLHDYSVQDMLAEGLVERTPGADVGPKPVSRLDGKEYIGLKNLVSHRWNQLYRKKGYGWNKNPWVCTVKFSVIERKG